eukprot:CAMPEP_0119201746 /NCGR_PEP_ID=MMETSP1316-20130426/30060_1 /TAXON_ID=41880 /ORGANISM="Pycnococcus provasolii, Strain RCC2336" /LENGTH=43 /DNA_ID= /DNA_START= /DNA_END= /DNA_ORIENTATION=
MTSPTRKLASVPAAAVPAFCSKATLTTPVPSSSDAVLLFFFTS